MNEEVTAMYTKLKNVVAFLLVIFGFLGYSTSG